MKNLFLLVIILLGVLTIPSLVLGVQIDNPLGVKDFDQLINALVNFIFWVGVALAPVMIIISGFIFVTAQGKPENITKAKNWLTWTIVGLTIAILAKGLVAVLQSVLRVK